MRLIRVSVFILIAFVTQSCLRAQTITTIAGGRTGSGGDGGPATAAGTQLPFAGSFDGLGRYYFGKAVGMGIRMIDASGTIHTLAGSGTSSGYGGDGGPATAAQMSLQGLDVDSIGNIYIADYYNNRLRKVDVATGIITTIAGNGTATSTGNGSLASAATMSPIDVAVDNMGNIYISDGVSPGGTRKIDAGTGIISQICPTSGRLFWRKEDNCLYIGTLRITRLNLVTGVLDTLAGTGVATYNGEGLHADSANFRAIDLAVDPIGNIFIADDAADRIRVIDTFGIIRTIAGNGSESYGGDGGPGTAASLSNPEGVSVDPCGNIYVADDANNRIRKITYPAHPFVKIFGPVIASISGSVTINATLGFAGINYTIKWYNRGTLFATTTTPTVTYTKTQCSDSITAMVYGCGDSAMSAVHVVGCNVGVPTQNNINEQVQLYPNPTTQMLHLQSPVPIANAEVYNLLGQVVATQAGNGAQEATLPLQALQPGLYWVKVNGLFVGRVRKE